MAELCTTVGVIERGELLFHGTLEEILRRAKTATRLNIRVTEQLDLAALLLERTRGIKSVEQRDGRLLVELEKHTNDFSPIARLLLKNNFKIREIKEEEVNLETAFMRLTKGMVQ